MNTKRKLSSEESKKYIQLRRNFPKPVIGITGNLGKTSTLAMVNAILSSRGSVLKAAAKHGSWKNNIHTLEKLNPNYDYALFEFDYQRGKHFGEILRLIKPTIGIVTNIGDAHLNYLGNMMQVALEKSAVVKYLARDGVAILNKDDELSSSLSEVISTKNIIKFGLSRSADFYATDIRQQGPKGMSLKVNGSRPVRLPFYSIQDVYNFLAALACGHSLDFDLKDMLHVFENHFQLPAGHGKLVSVGPYHVLDESYIGTPRSLSKAARSVIGFKNYSKHIFFIVGDMTGAGVNVEDQHLNMGYFLSALPITDIIAVGAYAKYIAQGASLIAADKKKIYSVNTTDEVLDILDKHLPNKAVLALKGIGPVAAHRIVHYLENKQTG